MTTAQNTVTLDIVVANQGTGQNATFRLSTYNPVVLTDSPGTDDQYALASGSNTVPVKSSAGGTQAQYLLLIPDPSNTVAFHYRGITSGDVGVLTTTQPLLVPIPPSTASVLITAASAGTCRMLWF